MHGIKKNGMALIKLWHGAAPRQFTLDLTLVPPCGGGHNIWESANINTGI